MDTAARGLDLSYRPDSYWESDDPISAITRDIKGEMRRRWVREELKAGESVPQAALRPSLDSTWLGKVAELGPHLLGGEYLPPNEPGEATIARIVYRTLTGHVVEIRARPEEDALRYRIVAETGIEYELPFTRSNRPLTFEALIRLVSESVPAHRSEEPEAQGLIRPVLDRQFRRWGKMRRADEMAWIHRVQGFISVSSRFYEELSEYVARIVNSWISGHSLRIPFEPTGRRRSRGGVPRTDFYGIPARPEEGIDRLVTTWGRMEHPGAVGWPAGMKASAEMSALRKFVSHHVREHGALPAGVHTIGGQGGGSWTVDFDRLMDTSHLVDRILAEGTEVVEPESKLTRDLKGVLPMYRFGERYYHLADGDPVGPFEEERGLSQSLYEYLEADGEEVAYHEYGDRGPRFGWIHVVRWADAYFVPHEGGIAGPYDDKETVYREWELFRVEDNSTEIWEEELGTVYPNPSGDSELDLPPRYRDLGPPSWKRKARLASGPDPQLALEL